jgi:hypothetical protein
VYQVLILTLERYYRAGDAPPHALSLRRLSRHLMSAILRPLCETLTELPAGPASPGKTAAPAFAQPGSLDVEPQWEESIATRLGGLAATVGTIALEGVAGARLALEAEHLTLAARFAVQIPEE